MQLLQYRLSDGMVMGIFESSNPTQLALQQTALDVYGYIMAEQALDAGTLAHSEVIAGRLRAKTQHTLEAMPNPFVADGVAECTVTVAPFVPCTLLVNGTSMDLSASDPELILTAEVPQHLTITLQDQVGAWAEPIRVEAL